MARPSPFRDPEFTKQVAEAFGAGLSRKEMADMFGVKDLDTITAWRKHPKVKQIVKKILEDRVIQVRRKVDGRIEAILGSRDLTVKELLAIRAAFGGSLDVEQEKADEKDIAEAQDLLEKNPDMAEQLEELLSTGNIRGVPPAPDPQE